MDMEIFDIYTVYVTAYDGTETRYEAPVDVSPDFIINSGHAIFGDNSWLACTIAKMTVVKHGVFLTLK